MPINEHGEVPNLTDEYLKARREACEWFIEKYRNKTVRPGYDNAVRELQYLDAIATLLSSERQLLDINARLEKTHKDQCEAAERAFVEYEKQIAELKAQRDTAYGYGQDGGEPPWMK